MACSRAAPDVRFERRGGSAKVIGIQHEPPVRAAAAHAVVGRADGDIAARPHGVEGRADRVTHRRRRGTAPRRTSAS